MNISPVQHFSQVLIILLSAYTLAVIGKEVGVGNNGPLPSSSPPHQPPTSSYVGPPSPTSIRHLYDSPPNHYDIRTHQQKQPPHTPHTFTYLHQHQPTNTYAEQAIWEGHNTGLVAKWVDKGIKLLSDVFPVVVYVVIIISILTFLGVINVPFFYSVTEARELIDQALAITDLNQLANTVQLAIEKYNKHFPMDN
ncbi:hypothetical protein Pcinc_011473 [Petrolisthes cinctipes]|uniref:Uncharacterized protein n=1 Tax=Petrolisthes cinctipes TaxID=88211 RepID=A0AAE1KUB9_PETCI|nr:hypothetical protein Pcinc_011473 [Petrolisthes cinctipes]